MITQIITIYAISVIVSGIVGLLTLQYAKYFFDYFEIIKIRSKTEVNLNTLKNLPMVMVLMSFVPLYNVYLLIGYIIMWIVDPKSRLNVDLYEKLSQLSNELVVFNNYTGYYYINELPNHYIYFKNGQYIIKNKNINNTETYSSNDLNTIIIIIKTKINLKDEEN